METLLKKHTFSYWKHYKKRNKTATIQDIDMMETFKDVALQHIKNVLRTGNTVVYNNDAILEKGKIQAVIDQSILVNDKLVKMSAIYYIIN